MPEPTYADLGDYDAEDALIGAALIRGPEVFEDPTVAKLLPRHFKHHRARDAWWVILRQKSKFDTITVATALPLDGAADADWLVSCMGACVQSYHAEQYARIVWDYARKRRVYQVISEISKALFNGDFETALEVGIKALLRVKEARRE